MSKLQGLTETDNTQALRETFLHWDQDKLLDYAVKVTRSLADREQVSSRLSGEIEQADQDVVRGMALVEEIGRSLASTLDLDEVLSRLLRLVNKAIGVEDGSILLVEEPSEDLVFQISLGTHSNRLKPFRVPRGHGIAGEVAQTGIPIRVENAQTDSRHWKKIDRNTGFLTKTILCVPLKTRGRVIGVVEVFNKRNGPFTEADEVLLGSIANYAAISIENARLHESVIAERDRVIQAQEEISNRLQRELHDGPTQLVAAIQMSIEFCENALIHDSSKIGPELEEMKVLAERATHQMRTMLFELRPLELETNGLAAALDTFIRRRQRSSKLNFRLEIKTDQADNAISRLEKKYEQALFGIVQEAVNNTLKYAQASNVIVYIHQKQDTLRLGIIDDGMGFDPNMMMHNYEQRGSYGMINQQERAAILGTKLTIKSAPGAGTETLVIVTITSEMLPQD